MRLTFGFQEVVASVLMFGAVASVFGPVDAEGRAAIGRQPAVYRKWPFCKRRIEFVEVVRKEDRVPGERYHERVQRQGPIQTYICLPCTRCSSGVRELASCSVNSDTVCSETECAVDGCVLDENLYSCRLPGDPNQFPSISAMMDPCDPEKIPIEPTRPKDPSTRSSQFVQFNTSLFKEDDKKTAKKVQAGPSSAEDKQDGGWGTLEMALVFSVIIIVIVIANVVGIFILCRKVKTARQCACGRGDDCNSTGDGEGMLQRAETQV